MGRGEGLYPTITTLLSLALVAYLFLFYLHRAYAHWQDEKLVPLDRRVPQRKWASLAFSCVLLGLGGWTLQLNGDLPVASYDFARAFLVTILLGLFWAIQRVEERDRAKENRRVSEEQKRRRQADASKRDYPRVS